MPVGYPHREYSQCSKSLFLVRIILDLVLRVEVFFHFGNFHVLDRLTRISLGIRYYRSFEQRIGELEGDNASTLVTHQNDGVHKVKGDMVSLCTF